MKKNISIIIPCLNEEKNITKIAKVLDDQAKKVSRLSKTRGVLPTTLKIEKGK